MSKAYRCDMCGKLLDGAPPYGGGMLIDFFEKGRRGYTCAEVCPECSKKLIAVFNEHREMHGGDPYVISEEEIYDIEPF